jgi:hypothetical protein
MDKLKNFHWHLSGSHFRDYHLLFDEQADQVLASIDLMAERVRRVGGITEASQKAPFFRYGDEWLFLLERGTGPRRRVRSTKIPS